MRKVTHQIADAFHAHHKATVGNTCTDGESVWLHGNKIISRTGGGEIVFSMCGWPSATTRERLNGILFDGKHAGICQRNRTQRFQEWGFSPDGNYAGVHYELGLDSRALYRLLNGRPVRVKDKED